MRYNFDVNKVPTPCYIADEPALIRNLEILRGVSERTGAKILLAQKAFSCYHLYPMIGEYLAGTACSGLFEARLGFEEMGKENHVFSAAYRESEIDEIISYCGHIIFNSFTQLDKYRDRVLAAGKKIGLRINPEHSTQEGHEIYDPCSPKSRLGITRKSFRDDDLRGVTGLHFHTLCEQNSDDLEATLDAVEEKFGDILPKMEWINFGGGHHITREDYDIPRLERCIRRIQEKYGLEVFLEPGEAIALNAGWLVTEVLDITENDMPIAILDTSAACHMPDVLEMPYRPPLVGSGEKGEKQFSYRLGSQTCLAGDVIGEYSFDQPLHIGDRLVFGDMAIYSMVKNNTFNGMPLPDIMLLKKDGSFEMLRSFGYEDFKERL
ncbi:carboxynorspermidine decarboxylase [Ruminococcus sp.]|uniref:carboxynorspermidine decarboxylase n=1 Tax=Ruminococcus sp. TaxID=41978 RepID=UPI0025CB940B|nr:carboxynorspermidine decarboxylase [Ruminococcus sp.]MCR4639314.1 carboxynorspermidine decarboxylase [Ruminococcus sp.]